jgi:XTP/dITP diphosphohydrolase
MKTLLLATHNKGKVAEFREMLNGLVDDLKSAGDYNLPEPEETETTFIGNAILKARAACETTGLPCLADDSGLSIDALNGDPGVYSARWAGEAKDFGYAMNLVNEKLGQTEGKTAHFTSVLALALPDGSVETFEGIIEGTLVWPPRGDKGFGYDPMFVANGHAITFGEMDSAAKHAISHRAIAVTKFLSYMKAKKAA